MTEDFQGFLRLQRPLEGTRVTRKAPGRPRSSREREGVREVRGSKGKRFLSVTEAPRQPKTSKAS